MIDTKRLYTIEDLETILDSLPCSIYIKDKEGKYIYTNKFAADISALEKDSIIGKTDFDLKDGREAYKNLRSDKKTLENGIPLLTEEYGINKTQNTPFSVYKIPLLNSKNVVTVSRPLDINSTTNIDFKKITYKKTNIDNQNNYSDFIIEILNNLCTILAASNVNIFLFNSDNSVINSYASSTINENIFYENITIKIDEPLLSKIDNKTNSFKRYKYINSILSKYYKKEYTTKNTSSFIVKALCFANKVIGILHINYDNITKYQINNEGLIKDICDNLSSLLVSFNVTNEFEKYVFKKNMINSVEYSPSILLSKMNYFATLSHEFKTPINIILSSIQLLLKLLSDNCEIDNDTLLKYLNILKQNSYRLLRLVNNVLDSSKLENNFTDLTLVNCNIINIIENIVLSTCDYLEQNNKEIIFDTDEEEVFLSCDPDKIEKVILNLISNSLKFTDSNGKIKVKIFTDYESKKLFVHVQNNGPEISVSDSKKIFSRFIQSDELFTKKNQGTGIGLFLCKSFIELHGGEIWANPNFKNGAEFIFYLPIKLTNSEKFDTLNQSTPSSKIEKCNIEFSDIYSI
ncbi:sensor histidine kinase [Clostridium saudiense]|uniref:sensor histidine kinase n=1 Tax=Clostridium saudiense TaxID=1414720 RepID=UPI002673BD00|nr:PAS domain-containing sensor histidine kinase [Clostridium saudiense]